MPIFKHINEAWSINVINISKIPVGTMVIRQRIPNIKVCLYTESNCLPSLIVDVVIIFPIVIIPADERQTLVCE